MKCRRLLVLPAFLLALGCSDDRQFTGPRAPGGLSEIISDGSHGGNPDFFFLPPMVPPPFQEPDYDQGEFNPRLQASLEIEICTLDSNYLGADGKPLSTTPCVGPLIKTFAPGSVDLVGVPAQQSGWWSNFNLPSDGFYKVLWDTRQHDLALDKYYRIKVLLDGTDEPLGYADVDPVSNMREWRHALTGDVVTMIDDSKLPIVFRVEKGALCEGATQCGSATLTNDNPNGDSQVLQVLNEDGVPVAGVLVPDGWLPEGGPQSVVFTIARVNTGVNDVAAGTQANPCHANLQLQQFDGCFHFSTIPELEPIDETGRQFATPIIGAVCFVLIDTGDPREPYVQLWSSEPDQEGDTPIPLRSADASAILTDPAGRNCGQPAGTVAANSSNPLTRFARAGWERVTKGFGRVFGVRTAYAVDLGLGGILDGISNIGPALSAELQRYTNTNLSLSAGATTTSTARVVGTQIHDGTPLSTGIGGVAVTYTLASGHGTLLPLGATGTGTSSVTVTTNSNPIDPLSPTSGGGFAPVNWTMPTVPGTYTLTATSSVTGGSVTFTATVAGSLPDLIVSTGAPVLSPSTISTSGGSVTLSPWTIANVGASFTIEGTVNNGFYLSADPVITTADTRITNNSNTAGVLEAGESFNWGGPTLAIPALAAGTWYIGILVDYTNAVTESNESNNYVSAPLTVVAPVVIDGVMSAGEWDDAAQYTFWVNLPGGGLTSGFVYLKNSSTQLYGAVRFSQNLSAHQYVIAGLRFDEDGNNEWDNGEDGLVVQQRIAGAVADGFFDEFFSCNVSPCQGQRDDAWGGTNDGVTKSSEATGTVIEYSKGINTSDPRDAALTAGQVLKFFVLTNIGESAGASLTGTRYPTTGWADYTVR